MQMIRNIIQTIKMSWRTVCEQAEHAKALKYLKEKELTALVLEQLINTCDNHKVSITIKMQNGHDIIITPTDNNKISYTSFRDRFNTVYDSNEV